MSSGKLVSGLRCSSGFSPGQAHQRADLQVAMSLGEVGDKAQQLFQPPGLRRRCQASRITGPYSSVTSRRWSRIILSTSVIWSTAYFTNSIAISNVPDTVREAELGQARDSRISQLWPITNVSPFSVFPQITNGERQGIVSDSNSS